MRGLKIKIWLWRIGILQNCPICGSEMMQKGHKKLWTRYECRKCNFGKHLQ